MVCFFSGSLPNLAISKCYHAMVFMAQLNNWERDTDGYFTITIAELDRITGGSCHTCENYQKLIDWVRCNLTIDWARFLRSGRYDTLGLRIRMRLTHSLKHGAPLRFSFPKITK